MYEVVGQEIVCPGHSAEGLRMPTTVTGGGITMTTFEDGTKVIDYPDGSSSTIFSSGWRIDHNPGGTEFTVTAPNGDTMIMRYEQGGDSGDNGDDSGDNGDDSGDNGDDSGDNGDDGDDGGDGDDSGDEDTDEEPPDDSGEMPNPDDDSGGKDDAGWRPKFKGDADVKDPMDVSDTGTVIRIDLDPGGGPVDPWDQDDDTGRRIKFAGGTVTIDPWEKVGPKFRPQYALRLEKGRATKYVFNRPALTRLMGTLLSAAGATMRKRGGRGLRRKGKNKGTMRD